MPRSGIIGTYSLPPNTNNQAPNTPISSSMFNAFASDVQQTFNDPTPVAYGGTGAATAAAAATALEVVSYAAQALSDPQKAQARANVGINTYRNLFVNGSFSVSQENGNTLGTTNGYYPADQIALYFTAATAAMSVQRVQVRTLANALDQIEFKTTTAKAVLDANDFVTLTQNIEGSSFAAAGFGTAAAVPLVLRAEVNLPAGTYHFHFANSANNRHCAVPFTIAPGEANTAVVKEIVVPPDTTGTWLTADGVIGITCDLVLAAGSGLTGGAASTWGSTAYLAASTQKNILDSTANVARLADIGLRLDPDATGVYGQYEVGDVSAAWKPNRYWRTLNVDMNFYMNAGGTNTQTVSFEDMSKTPTASVLASGATSNVTSTILTPKSRTSIEVGAVATALGNTSVTNRVLSLNARLS